MFHVYRYWESDEDYNGGVAYSKIIISTIGGATFTIGVFRVRHIKEVSHHSSLEDALTTYQFERGYTDPDHWFLKMETDHPFSLREIST